MHVGGPKYLVGCKVVNIEFMVLLANDTFIQIRLICVSMIIGTIISIIQIGLVEIQIYMYAYGNLCKAGMAFNFV